MQRTPLFHNLAICTMGNESYFRLHDAAVMKYNIFAIIGTQLVTDSTIYFKKDNSKNRPYLRHTVHRTYLTTLILFNAFRKFCIMMVLRCRNVPVIEYDIKINITDIYRRSHGNRGK